MGFVEEIGEYPLRLTHKGITIPELSNVPPAHPVYRNLEETMLQFLKQDIDGTTRKAQSESRSGL